MESEIFNFFVFCMKILSAIFLALLLVALATFVISTVWHMTKYCHKLGYMIALNKYMRESSFGEEEKKQ